LTNNEGLKEPAKAQGSAGIFTSKQPQIAALPLMIEVNHEIGAFSQKAYGPAILQ
jgi:hypothetical protein